MIDWTDIITVRQASSMLGMQKPAFYNWIKKGKVKAKIHPLTKRLLISRKEIQAIIDKINEQ